MMKHFINFIISICCIVVLCFCVFVISAVWSGKKSPVVKPAPVMKSDRDFEKSTEIEIKRSNKFGEPTWTSQGPGVSLGSGSSYNYQTGTIGPNF
jgi:hypothetical protein